MTLGYDDGERAPVAEMFAMVSRICKSVEVPVTVDAEAGYGMSVAEFVDRLLDLGVAGCNLEDTDHVEGELVAPSRQAEWLAAVRQAATERRYELVVNARVDVFIADRGRNPQRALLDEAIGRAQSYLSAGADCVYPILLSDAETIAEFVRALEAPVNILAAPKAPSAAQLAELGVARISYGLLVHQHTMGQLAGFLADIASQ